MRKNSVRVMAVLAVLGTMFLASCGGGGGPTVSAAADTEKPSVPTDFYAAPAGSTKIEFTWAASTDNVGVMGYRIYQSTDMDLVLSRDVTATSTSITGLSASTQFCYAVAAYDAAGNISDVSSEACAKTAPAAPIDLQATASNAVGVYEVRFSWVDNSSDETGFALERTAYDTACGSDWTTVTLIDANTTEASDAVPASDFCYRVRAYRTDDGVAYYSDTSDILWLGGL